MLVTEPLGTGLPETINLLKKNNTQNTPNICKVQMRYACIPFWTHKWVWVTGTRSARSEILELASCLHHDGEESVDADRAQFWSYP